MENTEAVVAYPELDSLQRAYQEAVERWIGSIREEASLANVNHTVAEIDQWEHAGFREEEARKEAKAAKAAYEDALRLKFFHI